MKKTFLSFILMAAGFGMANAAEPVKGIVCSYAGQEAFFPLSDAPQVKYVTKEGVQHAVVLVGGVEKLSVALANGGTLSVSYDTRAVEEPIYKAYATYDPTSGVCYGTFYADFAWTPADSEVHTFYVKSVVRTEGSGSDVKDCVQLQEIKGTVPAGTGVILASFTEGDVLIEKQADAADPVSGNLLRGVTEAQTVEAEAGESLYKLSFDKTRSRIAFYWDAEGGQSLEASANRAYLAIPAATAASAARVINFEDAIVTSLHDIMTGDTDGIIYNLQGQRVAPAAKGIYIKDGKKYLLK